MRLILTGEDEKAQGRKVATEVVGPVWRQPEDKEERTAERDKEAQKEERWSRDDVPSQRSEQ